MSDKESSLRQGKEEISPDWGNWSIGRALIWTLVGGAFIGILAGFATGSVVYPQGVAVGDGEGLEPISGHPTTETTDERSPDHAESETPSGESATWNDTMQLSCSGVMISNQSTEQRQCSPSTGYSFRKTVP